MAEISAFKINGVIDTSKTVLSNLNAICKSSGCWLTYDSTTGLWSVVINQPGSSIKSFDDTNIIGSISVTGTGIDQLYNTVEIQYPNQDLLSTTDSANFELTSNYRFPNELDKKLTLQYDLVNNPVQAQWLGAIELKQNRVDKIIQFRTDYTTLGLKAGDLIDVTNSVYGYTNKVFRVTKITEEDADDGSIQLSITALEYDATVYDSSGLIYSARTSNTGVVPKSMNTALTALDRNANSTIVTYQSLSTSYVQSKFQSFAGTSAPTWTGSGTSQAQTDFSTSSGSRQYAIIGFTLPVNTPVVKVSASTPLCTVDYQWLDSSGTIQTITDLTLYSPTQWQLQRWNGVGWDNVCINTTDWQTQSLQFLILNQTAGSYRFIISPIQTYDLNQTYRPYIFFYNHRVLPDSSGAGISLVVQGYNL